MPGSASLSRRSKTSPQKQPLPLLFPRTKSSALPPPRKKHAALPLPQTFLPPSPRSSPHPSKKSLIFPLPLKKPLAHPLLRKRHAALPLLQRKSPTLPLPPMQPHAAPFPRISQSPLRSHPLPWESRNLLWRPPIPVEQLDATQKAVPSVWKSGPVRFLTLRAIDRDRNRSFYFRIVQKTGPNRYRPVFCGLLRLTNRP